MASSSAASETFAVPELLEQVLLKLHHLSKPNADYNTPHAIFLQVLQELVHLRVISRVGTATIDDSLELQTLVMLSSVSLVGEFINSCASVSLKDPGSLLQALSYIPTLKPVFGGVRLLCLLEDTTWRGPLLHVYGADEAVAEAMEVTDSRWRTWSKIRLHHLASWEGDALRLRIYRNDESELYYDSPFAMSDDVTLGEFLEHYMETVRHCLEAHPLAVWAIYHEYDTYDERSEIEYG